MPFYCPQCSTPGSLEIGQSLALPPDSRSDEILIQVVQCTQCGFRGLAVYEESRRGALQSESWEHIGYRAEAPVVEAIAAALERCPEPNNPACACPSHRTLGQRDRLGRWLGFEGIDDVDGFIMIR